mgnify:FL=1
MDETKIKDDYRREKSKPLLATKTLRATRIRTPKEKSSNNIQIISEEVVTKKDDIKPKIVAEIKPEIKAKENERSIEFPKSMTTIERLRNEALGLTKKRSENIGNVKPEDKKNAIRKTLKELNVRTSVDFDTINKMNVHKLRNHARSFSNFPIKGREISRANRDELIAFFKTISS